MVFKIDPRGKETILHNFKGYLDADGEWPYAALVMDRHGNLYGTTYIGGKYGNGTVFKLAPNGHETILHSFTGGSDSASPYFGSLTLDEDGNLYGTSTGGQTGFGTVFSIKQLDE